MPTPVHIIETNAHTPSVFDMEYWRTYMNVKCYTQPLIPSTPAKLKK
jgi:hypothetical protein